nr:HlyD family efflux transporter periplasmic adaptor subunit [uncultured Campylobacter sp.]
MKRLLIFVVFALTALAAAIYFNLDRREEVAHKAYGIIDIRQSSLSFERSGRISALYRDEGDFVQAGDVLAALDTADLSFQRQVQIARCDGLKFSLQKLQSGFRSEEIEMAAANVSALQNALQLATLTNERLKSLGKTNSASKQQIDEAFYSMKRTQAQLQSAQANLRQLQSGYRGEDVGAARANLASCEENLKYLYYQIETQSVLKAPFSGQIRARLKELGDISIPSVGVFELSEVKNKRAKFYLSENQLRFLRAGQSVRIIAADGSSASAKVAYVSQTAMYTPRTVQTEELRADLVWEARADFSDEDGRFRLGQPISVEF